MACSRATYVGVCRRDALRLLPLGAAGFHPLSSPGQCLRSKGIVGLSHHRTRGFSLQASGSGIDREAKTNPTLLSIKDGGPSERWRIKMLYDGECPLCMHEVNMLRERNKTYKTIKFVDISSKDYKAEDHQGIDYEMAMGRIHAILCDGTVIKDVEVFQKLYKEVGLGWVFFITKYEPVATITNAVYGIWARYRLQITGRPPLEELLVSKRKDSGKLCRDDNACKM